MSTSQPLPATTALGRIEKLSVAEIRDRLRAAGLSPTGTKRTLAKRLHESLTREVPSSPSASLAKPRLLGRGEGLVKCPYATCSTVMLGYVTTNRNRVTFRNTRSRGGVFSSEQVVSSPNGLGLAYPQPS